MSIGTLWATPTDPLGKFVRSVAALQGLEIDLPEGYKHFVDNKSPEFLAKFPLGKIPAFEDKDGFLLTEALAIARYFAKLAPESALLGKGLTDEVLIDQWVSFSIAEIHYYTRLITMLLGLSGRGGATYDKFKHFVLSEMTARSLRVLNTHLEDRVYMVTDQLTLADIAIASSVEFALSVMFDAKLRAELPNIVRHYELIVKDSKIGTVLGHIKYIDTRLTRIPAA